MPAGQWIDRVDSAGVHACTASSRERHSIVACRRRNSSLVSVNSSPSPSSGPSANSAPDEESKAVRKARSAKPLSPAWARLAAWSRCFLREMRAARAVDGDRLSDGPRDNPHQVAATAQLAERRASSSS